MATARHCAAVLGMAAFGLGTGCQAPNFGGSFDAKPLSSAAGETGNETDADSNDDAADGMGSDAAGDEPADSAPGDGGAGADGGPVGTTGAGDSATDAGVGSSGAAEGSGGQPAFVEVDYEFTTAAYGGKYDPDHIVAVWIEQDGAFVRTLEVHADKRREHLIAWRLSSGDDLTDAITSATIKNGHGTLSGVWNLMDSTGAAVGPGDYSLRIELVADDANDGAPPGPVLAVPITVGGAGFDETMPGAASIFDVHVWSQ